MLTRMVKIHFCFFLVVTQLFGTFVKTLQADYDFEVFPVDKCPLSKENWEMRARDRKCNSTHGYHCVPNKYLTSLLEFCYPKGVRIPFESGYCLELAGRGILNQVPCKKTFSKGCPETFFFSQDIYKYPKCLSINAELQCFDADVECVYSRLSEDKAAVGNKTTTERNTVQDADYRNSDTNKNTETVLVVLLVLVIVTSITGLIGTLLYRYLWKSGAICNRTDGQEELTKESERLSQLSEMKTFHKTEVHEEGKPLLQCLETEASHKKTTCVAKPFQLRDAHNLSIHTVAEENKQVSEDESDTSTEEDKNEVDINLQKIHDAILKNDEREFEHLSRSFVKDSLELFNNKGFNSLHLSAKSGNQKFFHKILDLGLDIKSKALDGRNCLHIAAYSGGHSICKYLLESDVSLFLDKDRYDMNPAHWAALGGQDHILELMMKHKCDLNKRTKYGENLVLFACIGEHVSVCKFVKEHEGIQHLLHAKNTEGWNSIQYAAKSGNSDVFKFLVDNDVDIKNESKQTQKNCLHTACEKGSIEICQRIMLVEPNLIKKRSISNQHVGHYAAKSGNTAIMQFLIEQLDGDTNDSLLALPNKDNINILHIACKHARYDMCVFIAEKYPSLVNEISEKGWNAALFLTEKAGAEKDRIKMLKYLKKHKLNVYHVSRSGKTILYNACVNRSPRLVKHLLKHYPDLLDIEKSMNARKAAKSEEIESIFNHHFGDA